MERVAVLTSGGDAPGMNAAIRAAVRTGLSKGWRMFGVHHGYKGLMDGDMTELGARDVGGIIQAGGTTAELMALAAGSTSAGNLMVLGAASNVIIIQNAEKQGETLTFFEFAKVGVPLTVLQLVVYWVWLMLLPF